MIFQSRAEVFGRVQKISISFWGCPCPYLPPPRSSQGSFKVRLDLLSQIHSGKLTSDSKVAAILQSRFSDGAFIRFLRKIYTHTYKDGLSSSWAKHLTYVEVLSLCNVSVEAVLVENCCNSETTTIDFQQLNMVVEWWSVRFLEQWQQ